MRVVVLGASGFLGRHVVPALVRAGHEVVAVARHPPAAGPNVEPRAADVLDAAALSGALQRAEACVNLVGVHHGHGAQSFERVHVELARQLCAAAVPRVVQVSVLCARPDAKLAYHDSKHRGDALIASGPGAWTILRPSIVFGADDAFTTRLARLIRLRVVPIPGRGDALHAPVHVDDLASAVERSLARPEALGKILPLTGLRTLSYAQIVAELAARAGHGVLMPRMPLGLMRAVARASRWMADPPLSAAQLAMITEGMAGDSSPSWALLGLEPRGFDAAHLR